MGAKVTLLGAAGYSGGEVARLVSSHPGFELVAVSAEARAGTALGEVHPQLAGAPGLELVPAAEALGAPCDVLFSCLPGGAFAGIAGGTEAGVVIDLSDDFRSDPGWAYGLSEWARSEISGATRIANPGCYPTAALLCLLPFAAAGAIAGPVIIDAISGVSGAGRRAEERYSFAAVASGVAAYGSTTHRHLPEIERGLARLGGGLEAKVSFTPHLAPMARGLLVTARAGLLTPMTDDQALEVLRARYEGEPMVTATDEWPGTKPLTGTNRAHVSARVDARNGLVIASAAIDNLGKGAAGQAVQNANLALGLHETSGLDAHGVWP